MEAEKEYPGLNPPLRKPSGSRGMPICLNTNYFAITPKAAVNLVQYDVSIEQERKNRVTGKKQMMKIFETMKATYPEVFRSNPLAFDSFKNAYSVEVLPAFKKKKTMNFEVTLKMENDDEDPMSFTVQLSLGMSRSLMELIEGLKCTNVHKTIPNTIFRMLEAMLRYRRSLKYEPVGKKRFFAVNKEISKPIDLSKSVQGVTGFFSSMKPSAHGKGSIMINMDLTHTTFYKEQPLLDFIENVHRVRRNDLEGAVSHRLRRRLECGLEGLRVQTTHIFRTYRIIGLSMYGADRQTFPWKNCITDKIEQRTVQDYFKKEYKKVIQHPSIICVQAHPEEKNIYLPMEYCVVARGQRSVETLSNHETAAFIRSTPIAPARRLEQIQKMFNDNEFTKDEIISSLKFEVAKSPFTVMGRVLSPPCLKMGKDLKPQRGEWDARKEKFFRGAAVNTWAVIDYINIKKDLLKTYIHNLCSLGRRKGMAFKSPVSVTKGVRKDVMEEFQNLKRKFPEIQMILVVLEEADSLYSRIKVAGDLEISVITQCVKRKSVEEGSTIAIRNLLFKVNAKMGGINSVWKQVPMIMKHPFMVMGVDVNHPSVGDVRTPSMAAVVASLDRFASKYAVEVRPQKHRNEIIQDFKAMTKNLLKSFYIAINKFKPQSIFVYRDGITDKQFGQVLQHEMLAIREACKEIEETYKPAITFVVVKKRHHTRLFPKQEQHFMKNIPPGTVVDSGITHPIERDFFLCSHHGIKGTSRPTHYHILWDDNNLTMDQLEEFTYKMCHMYSRCNKSISLPAPVAYAHLAAFRAKVHATEVDKQDRELKRIQMDREKKLSTKLYYI
ncbi:protein argonaute-2-like [Penaeus japonicus]|uniref:protein argonaute-2-like n=1 Tax=Penaeus japonicus TaxID=27405 RepID=UPI001C7106CB|nr:protein argonaute-2-like [Penaeus japonicus]